MSWKSIFIALKSSLGSIPMRVSWLMSPEPKALAMLSFCAAQANSVSLPNPPDSAAARALFAALTDRCRHRRAGSLQAAIVRSIAVSAAIVARLSPVIGPIPPPAGHPPAHGHRAAEAGPVWPIGVASAPRCRESRLYAWAVVAGEGGGRGVRIPFRDPGWFATVVAGSTALGLAAAILLLRLLGPSELAVIPTEAWRVERERRGRRGWLRHAVPDR
jgi:hypothetical protein